MPLIFFKHCQPLTPLKLLVSTTSVFCALNPCAIYRHNLIPVTHLLIVHASNPMLWFPDEWKIHYIFFFPICKEVVAQMLKTTDQYLFSVFHQKSYNHSPGSSTSSDPSFQTISLVFCKTVLVCPTAVLFLDCIWVNIVLGLLWHVFFDSESFWHYTPPWTTLHAEFDVLHNSISVYSSPWKHIH